MERDLTPDERRELLGAYALGALDDDERAQVEELVLADPDARAELHTLQLGVAWLDHASTRAPMHVWRDIAREIEHEAGTAADATDEPADRPAPVVDLATRRSRGIRRVTAVAAALGLGLAVGIGVLVADRGSEAPTVAQVAARAEQQTGSSTVALRTAEGHRAGTVVVTPEHRAYLVWADPPPPASDRQTYQLWELTPAGPRSAGLLGPEPHDHAFRLDPDASGVAVTLEPRGGSPTPTGTPVVMATLV